MTWIRRKFQYNYKLIIRLCLLTVCFLSKNVLQAKTKDIIQSDTIVVNSLEELRSVGKNLGISKEEMKTLEQLLFDEASAEEAVQASRAVPFVSSSSWNQFSFNTISPQGFSLGTSDLAQVNNGITNIDFETGNFEGWQGFVSYHPNMAGSGRRRCNQESNYSFEPEKFIQVDLANPTYPVNCSYTKDFDYGIDIQKDPDNSNAFIKTFVNGRNDIFFRHQIITGNSLDTYGEFPVVAPGSIYSVRLGNNNNYSESEKLVQEFYVSPADTLITYNVAIVLEEPSHNSVHQPFFRAVAYDAYGREIPCSKYEVKAAQNIPGFVSKKLKGCAEVNGNFICSTFNVIYRPWSKNIIDLSDYVGQKVKLEFVTSDCAFSGGHAAYAYIDGSNLPVNVFAKGVQCVGSSINFSSSVTGNYLDETYVWDFGDGTTSNEQSPCHTYAEPGTYTTSLTISSPSELLPQCQQKTYYKVVVIAENCSESLQPKINFDACSLWKGQEIAFSTPFEEDYLDATYLWSFGDGSNSSEVNPTHIYRNTGNYNVGLTIKSPQNSCASNNIFSSEATIFISDPKDVNIIDNLSCTGEKSLFYLPEKVNPENFIWDFGDGTISTEVNPSHTYNEAGSYTVSLNYCEKTIQKIVTIESCLRVQDLRLIALCSDRPSTIRNWQLQNLNDFDVEVRYQLQNSNKIGTLIAKASDDTFFFTHTVPDNSNSLTVFWQDEKDQQQELTETSNPTPCQPFICEECIPSFSPLPGEKYVLSTWVKEANQLGATTYEQAAVTLEFAGAEEQVTFKGSGVIINGWQRIEAEFTVPQIATSVTVRLMNEGASGDVYFDDIRIHPFNANMKSFVYDPVSMRLMAELDERNYATFYEYDEEGALIRVKKETERGVKTIQESRNHSIKVNP